MRRPALVAAALIAATLSGCGAGSSVALTTLSGSGPATSGTFDPTGAWVVSYRWDCTGAVARGKTVTQELRWDVYNGDDQTYAADHPHVQLKGRSGTGEIDYAMRGAYYLSVSSGCDYTLQVKPR